MRWNVSLPGWDRHTSPLICPGLLPDSTARLPLIFFFPCNSDAMILFAVLAVTLLGSHVDAFPDSDKPTILRACPDYVAYASTPQ